MAFPSPPPTYSSALLFSLLLLLAASASTSNAEDSAADSLEFDDMLQSLRNFGYTLFTNAIATSDLKYQLLGGGAAASNFTLFAPKDELLYALDMATDAAVYVSTLRYHVVPDRRHTFADLKNLSAPFLDTLLPHYAVLIGKVRDVDESTEKAAIGLIVDGVRLEYPDLFVGSRIVVHGIDGILLTGLKMSRDPEGNDDGSDHFPPVGSPAPTTFDAIHPPTSPEFGRKEISPSPAFPFDGSAPVAPVPNGGNIPAEGNQTPNAPDPPANGNFPATENGQNVNVPAATAASGFNWFDIPAAGSTHTISHDQIGKTRILGRKGLRKGRRRHRKHRALVDL